VTVDITPDGYGDSVKLYKYFVTPLEEKMPFNHFMDIIEGKKSFNGIVYCQHQNTSFTTEFQQLNNDIHELNWVREAFGSFKLYYLFLYFLFYSKDIHLMLSIFGLVHRNQYQLFIMIHMKIFMVLYVVENISHSIHQPISIG
jgi:hypothetical protein